MRLLLLLALALVRRDLMRVEAFGTAPCRAATSTSTGRGRRATKVSATAESITSTKHGPRAPSSVYVNLPFCRRRCFYCDFPIKVVGDRPGAAAAAARPYVDNVVREIRATAADAAAAAATEMLRKNPGNFRSDGECVTEDFGSGIKTDKGQGTGGGVKTLFFGGGTPSLCPPELVRVLIETVRQSYGIATGAEISIEMDPGTFDEALLEEFLALGITRVSMGVQSFDAGLLKACGRAHSLPEVYQAVELLRKANMENFSIDLMSGLPGQTVEQWEHTLSEAISTGAAHISVYDLQVEAGTPFGSWFTPGEAPLPEDQTCADMYRTASKVLGGAGYDHYEISNYARPGFQSRHNRAYWENVPFHAFGNGAASYVDGHRFSRPRGLPEYGQWVDRLTEEGWAKATGAVATAVGADGAGGEEDEESRKAKRNGPSLEALERDALLDDVMLGFRLKEGLDLQVVAENYGPAAVRRVEEGVAEGLQRGWVIRERPTGISAGAGVVGGGSDVVVVAGGGGEKVGNKRSDQERRGGRVRVDAVETPENCSKGVAGATTLDDVGNPGRSSGIAEGANVGADDEGAAGNGKEELGAAAAAAAGAKSANSSGVGLGRLRLSDPDGFLFSNSVISSVFCELDGWGRNRDD
ncbi:unnamed protein product [Scytosiphon promiscuus]